LNFAGHNNGTSASRDSYKTMTDTQTRERLRAICLALPGTSERGSHGEPTWFAGKKTFGTYADHHDDRLAFWCAVPPGPGRRHSTRRLRRASVA
jgi:hypothetical protein